MSMSLDVCIMIGGKIADLNDKYKDMYNSLDDMYGFCESLNEALDFMGCEFDYNISYDCQEDDEYVMGIKLVNKYRNEAVLDLEDLLNSQEVLTEKLETVFNTVRVYAIANNF